MLRLLLISAGILRAGADSIIIQIAPDRSAVVREHISLLGAKFEFLESPCFRVLLPSTGTGPWFAVPIASAAALTYRVVPVVPSPRTCAVPIVMPRQPINSVSVTVIDGGSGLRRIAVPQLAAQADPNTWIGTFPAIPSRVELEWDSGNPSPASTAGPSGSFNWNFRGLVAILVTWTIAYLWWARRQAA